MSEKKELKKEVIEVLGYVRGDETGWGINVSKISWDGAPSTLNIRNVNSAKDIIGKGVALSDYEADVLTDILVNSDYGSVEALKEAVKRREFFTDYGEIVNENEVETSEQVQTLELGIN